MSDLSYQELMDYCDGRTTPSRTREIEAMIAASYRLQQELRLLRSLDHGVRKDIPSPVPARFTQRVVSALQPSRQELFLYRIARSSSALFAMAMVLAVIGLAVGPDPVTGHPDRSLFSSAVSSFRTVYDGAAERVSGWTTMSLPSVSRSIHLPSGSSLIIGLAVFFLFILLDEMMGKRYHRQTFKR
ncbi:MAG: hypothetical protein HUU02_03665 [Bacteroidetes bacterium]|nr:hypothetical protein [Bacteroidota bacterium]